MSALLATLDRELRAYFISPLGWAVMTLMLLSNGGHFWILVAFLADPRAGGSATPLQFFFGQTIFFWLVLIVVATILTMRLLAEERKTGTIEVLMTAPVTETQVVLGKFLAATIFYVALWLPSLIYGLIIGLYSEVDWGPVASGYVGVVGIGMLFLSIGLFCSALFKSQIVAGMATFFGLMVLWVAGIMEGLFDNEVVKETVGYMNLWQHMEDFSRGIVDSRRLIYYLSVTALFLFLSTRALAARKWR